MARGNKQFLGELNKALKNNIRDSVAWLDSGEAQKFYMQRQDRLDNFFDESDLQDKLLENGDRCYRSAEQLIEDIYKYGAQNGYRQIRKDRVFTLRDRRALRHLLRYDYRLIADVNEDHIHNIKNCLIEGVVEGKHPVEIAKDIRQSADLPVDGRPSPKARSIMIARTESIRALNEGTLNAYRNYGVRLVDWITADDSSVCDDCINMELDNPHNIDAIEIPLHPNCRCTIRAHIIDDKEEE